MSLCQLLFLATLLGTSVAMQGVESWQSELVTMPLGTNRIHFFKGEPARAILQALKPNRVVKAIVMMPCATDELYFNDRGTTVFTNTPTILDAVRELTNHTSILATFSAPFLLLGETNDYSEPLLSRANFAGFESFRQRPFTSPWLMIDKEWDHLYPTLTQFFGLKLSPALGSPDAWHFYRVYFAAHNINAQEAIALVSLSTQTEVRGEKNRLVFVRRAPLSSSK
jgi:hypothetical protein